MTEKDQDKRLSSLQCLQHGWFGVTGGSEVLDDAMEGIKELQENDAPTDNTKDASNPLLTITPVMAGRKLKDTCESPWNPSGTTPKMAPATPLLRYGFDKQPRYKNDVLSKVLPNPAPAPTPTPAPPPTEEEAKKKLEATNKEIDNFKRFEMMQQKRKDKKPQGTMNFGKKKMAGLGQMKEESPEENKIDPKTNMPVQPNKIENIDQEANNSQGNVLNKIISSGNKPEEEKSDVQKFSSTPETKPHVSDMKVNYTDSMVNIEDELLRECPSEACKSGERDYTFKSFKPGV
mmetsp:Transcript_12495/g.14042  ORF Transcript_12495/g.14042 Transcript_12495/m.14042 type:complete len:290 (+) Transcript_12495:601-1470(+)|eukprot:CAMPEP_0205831548 /NCGR_PEP_ID=MMETSP0206-20130828/44356_1 /ASSEMBLY_ACC=CAM_ASM_000279 /TAXON_ID=36767 /ORGANISM="Euplotes focardii, Strain TN1" /LENGTH=289 /DNA_ID=CAMNT_0053136269 /DNA_START=601 /DNA_END=1470 /DNA_ORIENTATION=-